VGTAWLFASHHAEYRGCRFHLGSRRSGPSPGFAYVLVLGIFTSVFTSVMGSRALVQIIYGDKRKLERLSS
jgi:preprotein translocase subunit SecD